jgi:hypothetical protein
MVLIGALFLFGLGLYGANQKINRQLQASELLPLPRLSPTPTPRGTKLQFFTSKDLIPLPNISIQLRAESFCTSDAPCVAANPELYTTDTAGMIVVPTETIQQQPIIAVDGYRKDSYFIYLNPESPTELTLYNAPGDVKRSYDIRHEIIPIYLDPLP